MGGGVDRAQCGGGRCVVSAQVKDAPNKCSHWTGIRVATAGMADGFPFDAILLRCKGECCKGGEADRGGVGCGCRVRLIAKLEGDVLETKRLACRICWRVRVFTGAEQKEET